MTSEYIQSIINKLSAKHDSKDMDKLEFGRRISSEHLFTSVDEAVYFIHSVIGVTQLLSDDYYKYHDTIIYKNQILAINIIDEGICSIIYEIYLQRSRDNKDNLAYINLILSILSCNLRNYIEADQLLRSPLFINLYEIVERLIVLSMPTIEREENNPNELSYEYYTMMMNLYSYMVKYFDESENFYYYVELKKWYTYKLASLDRKDNTHDRL